MHKSCAALAAMALIAVAGAAPLALAADTPALDFTGVNGSFLDGNNRMIGWQFSVPQGPLSASARALSSTLPGKSTTAARP